MLYTIDVGNSETKLGVFDRNGDGTYGKLVRTWRLTTTRRRTADEYGALFTQLLTTANLTAATVERVVISSVVPFLDTALAQACALYFDREPVFFKTARQTLIAVETERPSEVGTDMVVAALGAKHTYGAPLIVIHYGTASTFTAVSASGALIGTAIAPGIQISIEALAGKTAKLPQVRLEAPSSAIGRETIGSLQAGIVFGFVGQTEGLIARIRRELGSGAKVVATGGLAEVVARETTMIDAVHPYLTLEGLRIFAQSL